MPWEYSGVGSLKPLIDFSLLLIAWLLSVWAFAGSKPGFYQHLEVPDPDSRVSDLLDRGWIVRGYEPFPLVPPLDWSLDPHNDPNWQYQLNALYPLAPVFQLLAAEYRSELHALARAVVDDWIAFNLEQDIAHPFRWNDMATGIRAAYLAQLIYHERTKGGDPYLKRYVNAGLRHLQELSDPRKLAMSNHALFQLVGIAALCEVLEEAACVDALPYAQLRYTEVFDRQFNEEGMHLEHSPEYHLLALKTFKRIEASGLLTLSEHDEAVLLLAAENLSLMIHPDGGFAAVGDTESDSVSGADAFYPVDRPGSRTWLFPQTGYAMIRAQDARGDGSYVFFTAAHHSRIHKHLDTGSFEWSDRGQRVLVDSGKWGYGRSIEREYVIGRAAHNTVETRGVDNSPGDLPEEPAELTSFSSDSLLGLVANMRVPRRLLDADFRRTIVTVPGDWLLVVDQIEELLPSTHTFWFHLAPVFSVAPVDEKGFEATAIGSDRLRVVPLLPVSGSSSHRGVEAPRMMGWYSPEYGELEPNWQIGYEARGRNVRVATLFSWIQEDKESSFESASYVSADGMHLCWREEGQMKGISMREVNDELKVEACE